MQKVQSCEILLAKLPEKRLEICASRSVSGGDEGSVQDPFPFDATAVVDVHRVVTRLLLGCYLVVTQLLFGCYYKNWKQSHTLQESRLY